jgi:hypothetical protein
LSELAAKSVFKPCSPLVILCPKPEVLLQLPICPKLFQHHSPL